MAKVTQQDIANKLNISRTTVARALNGNGYVDQKTKQKVIEIAKATNYTFNPLAKSLAMKTKTNVFAFLVDSSTHNVFEDIKKGLKAAEKEFAHFSINLEVFTSNPENPEEQVKMIENILNNERVDAIMVTPLLLDPVREIIRRCTHNNIPTVTINMDIPDSTRMFYVGPDYYKGGRLAAEILATHIQKKGKIGILSSTYNYVSINERLKGFMDKINDYKEIYVESPIFCTEIEEINPSIIDFLDKNKDICAIYTALDTARVASVLKDTGNNNIKLIGNDLSEDINQYIKQDYIQASIYQRQFLQGYLAGQYLFRYLSSRLKSSQDRIITGYDIVTQENMDFDNVFTGLIPD